MKENPNKPIDDPVKSMGIKSAQNFDHIPNLVEQKKHIQSTLAHCGIEMFSCVLAGLIFGLFIDKHFGTRPIFIIAGFMLGITTAFYNIIKLVKK